MSSDSTRPAPTGATSSAKCIALAEQWEREAMIALGNSKITRQSPAEAEACRTAHGYLLHCAGQLRDAIDVPRVVDEAIERKRALAVIRVRTEPGT